MTKSERERDKRAVTEEGGEERERENKEEKEKGRIKEKGRRGSNESEKKN